MSRCLCAILVGFLFWTMPARCLADGEASVLRLRLEGAIGPMTAKILDRAVNQAEASGAACLVVELDTPGGLDVAMRQMVKRILSADVPVVVYVAPGGSRAASAGAFITIAAHVAAMAPGTNIGAAHPVQMGGAISDTTMAAKVANDAAAYIRSLADKRGRNADWAEAAVRNSESIPATEALKLGVIDLIAPSFPALLDSLDGRDVEVLTGSRTLHTSNAPTVDFKVGLRDRMLGRLSEPNIAYILMILGFYGLVFELYNPGALLPGIVGGICLILAFFSFQALPVNYAGLLLILLGIVFFVLEIKVTSYGALTIGGLVSMALGSAMLFDTPGGALRVSWAVIAPTVIATGLFFTFAVAMGIRAQKRPPIGGQEELIGRTGVARSPVHAEGTVFLAGEYWQAVSEHPIPQGHPVRVVAVRGPKLAVVADRQSD